MTRSRRAITAALAFALLVPAQALAGVDDTAPVGTVEVVHDDRDAGLVRLHVPATDDIGAVTTVEVSGNGTVWQVFPYAPDVDWSAWDPSAGGSASLGRRTVRVRWTDSAGNTSTPVLTTLDLLDNGAIETPDPPVTGQVFTMRPIAAPGVTPEVDETCTWELRWGNNAALDVYPNETYGSQTIFGPPDRGYCGEWRVTLPWVPVPQFEVVFSGIGINTESGATNGPRYVAKVASTNRRITSSNFPLVQVLPNKYLVAVGETVTYTAYPLGTSIRAGDVWGAVGPNGILPPQYGTTTYRLTPNAVGVWLVFWNGSPQRPYGVGATYDPPAKRPDTTPPNTTAPIQNIGTGTPGPNVPVAVTWSGSDVGWGIERFQIHRSINGGGWQVVPLATYRTTSINQLFAPGVAVRYRVRAIDKRGNVGAWDYGPTFKTRLVSDADPSIVYAPAWATEADGTAIGGGLKHSSTAGQAATFSFVGRDVAWVAEKGPGKGLAEVFVDGVLRATVNLESASDAPRQIVFRRHWATDAKHVVRIVVEGTGGHPTVTVDGFLTLR